MQQAKPTISFSFINPPYKRLKTLKTKTVKRFVGKYKKFFLPYYYYAEKAENTDRFCI